MIPEHINLPKVSKFARFCHGTNLMKNFLEKDTPPHTHTHRLLVSIVLYSFIKHDSTHGQQKTQRKELRKSTRELREVLRWIHPETFLFLRITTPSPPHPSVILFFLFHCLNVFAVKNNYSGFRLTLKNYPVDVMQKNNLTPPQIVQQPPPLPRLPMSCRKII